MTEAFSAIKEDGRWVIQVKTDENKRKEENF